MAGLLLLFAMLGAMPRFAHAQAGLAEADRAYAAGESARAGRAYEDALFSGGLEPDGVARAHLRLAAISALGDEDAAFERHAEAALAIDPQIPAATFSEAYSARFEALRRARSGARLRVVLGVSDAGSPTEVEVRDAPDGLVRTLSLRGASWSRVLPWEGERLSVAVPPEAHPLRVSALDRHGNIVARVGVPAATFQESAPEPSESAPPAPSIEVGQFDLSLAPPEDESPLVESPWLWVVVGLLAVGIGVAVGLTAFGERYVLDPPVIR